VKVLLAGATGAVGRPLVRRLVDAGHEVVGLTRRPERTEAIEAAGARAVACDVLDLAAVRRAVAGAQPDVVMDQTTALPQRYDPRKMDVFYKDMGPLRLIGSPNLLDAAREAGARHVFQSIAFIHPPAGPNRLRTEDDPVWTEGAPAPWSYALPMIAAMEQRTVAYGGLVLRYGFFYGPGTHFAPGGQFHDDIIRRRMPIVGRGEGVGSFIHVEDAAAAAVAAVDRHEPGILNVVDDRPLQAREWLPAAAKALGAKRPLRVPAVVARPLAGPMGMHFSTTMPGVSNARARERLGWAPQYPSVLDGLRADPA
jgi:nucleoside-diphosphate-sugar epimerase